MVLLFYTNLENKIIQENKLLLFSTPLPTQMFGNEWVRSLRTVLRGSQMSLLAVKKK